MQKWMLIGSEFDGNNNQSYMSYILNSRSSLKASLPKGQLKFYSDFNKMKQAKTNQLGTE